jgi:class 3 adenylate cyclase
MSITESLGGGEARLWRLIAERCKDEADIELIDQKIWDLFGERWAVMFTDLSGFSRGVAQFGIIHFLQIIYQHNTLVAPIIDDHQGFLLKVEGDSLMALFRRPQAALDCAIAMQQACQRISKRKTSEEEILLCIGLGYGDVLRIGEHEVFGAQVNAASKLGEDTAGPNEILVTEELANACGGSDQKIYSEVDAVIPGAKRVFLVEY